MRVVLQTIIDDEKPEFKSEVIEGEITNMRWVSSYLWIAADMARAIGLKKQEFLKLAKDIRKSVAASRKMAKVVPKPEAQA